MFIKAASGAAIAAYLLGTNEGRLILSFIANRMKGKKATKAQLAKAAGSSHHHEYEFGGPVGSVGMIFGLPVGVFSLIYALQQPSISAAISGLLPAFSGALQRGFSSIVTGKAVAIVIGWFVFQVLIERLVPGSYVKGQPLPPAFKKRLTYKVNGHRAFWISIASLCAGHYSGVLDLGGIYNNYTGIAAVAVIFSALLSVHLYASSFLKGKLLAEGGTTDSSIYNFFMGRELNPRIGDFDWKYFCELRPGLIGWTAVNLGMAVKQYQLTGAVSAPLVMVNFFQGLYVWDALYYEEAILSTMDITTEGFGFMLALGDMGWVPFTYSLQALYLVGHDPGMSMAYYAVVSALGALGYCCFRGSNGLKDRFRREYKSNPEQFKGLRTMSTKRGTRLITGSWWGVARKINYTGDIVMATAWSMFCGGAVLPYFYPMYLFGLLTHRAFRDDAFCQKKYGEDWNKYKNLVPYLIIPGVF